MIHVHALARHVRARRLRGDAGPTLAERPHWRLDGDAATRHELRERAARSYAAGRGSGLTLELKSVAAARGSTRRIAWTSGSVTPVHPIGASAARTLAVLRVAARRVDNDAAWNDDRNEARIEIAHDRRWRQRQSWGSRCDMR